MDCPHVKVARLELWAGVSSALGSRTSGCGQLLAYFVHYLKQIRAALGVGGKGQTLIELLRTLGAALGLKLTVKYAQETQPDGKRPRLVCNDPGVRFELKLSGVAKKWQVWSPALGAKVRVADWQHHHAEQQQLRAEDTWAGADDNGDLFNDPFRVPEDDLGDCRSGDRLRITLD